jgi:hypothetical protein
MDKPLVEITRLGPVTKVLHEINTNLGRLATALEYILIEEYGFHAKPAVTDTKGPEPEVQYTDQDEYDIEEIVEAVKE